jgi:uncharacterized protein YcbK (DUF882 family)
LYDLHTGERFDDVYWADGHYLPEALNRINYLLRDFRTNAVTEIDTALLDILNTLCARLDVNEPFHVVSGYRSPETNAMLRRQGRGVAKNSYHVRGKAVDIRLPGCDLSVVREAALQLKAGGVGYYPRSGFVHLDTGPTRRW